GETLDAQLALDAVRRADDGHLDGISWHGHGGSILLPILYRPPGRISIAAGLHVLLTLGGQGSAFRRDQPPCSNSSSPPSPTCNKRGWTGLPCSGGNAGSPR